MKKINESQLAARVNNLRDYLSKIDEAPLYNMDPQNKPGATPAPTGNSFDAKLAQANAAAKAKGGRTGPAPVAKVTPDPKGPGARPNGWTDRMMGNDKRWDAQYAAKYNPDGTAKKGAVAVAKAKTPAAQQAADPVPAAPGTPAAATSVDAAKQAGADMNKEPAQAAAPAATGPWPAGSPQAAAWAALSPEDQKWLGGADPTDQMILARAPNGGKPAAPAQGQGASPAPVAGATQDMGDGSKITTGPNGQVASTDSDGNPYVAGSNPNLPKNKMAAQGMAAASAPQAGGNGTWSTESIGENTTFQNDELNRIISLVQHR
jgi:hypothetical protein